MNYLGFLLQCGIAWLRKNTLVSRPDDEAKVKERYPQARISPIQSTPGYLDLFFMIELKPGVPEEATKSNTPEEAWCWARALIDSQRPWN